MLRVGVIGINHQFADLQLRECFAKVCKERFCAPKFLNSNPPIVLLSTCNRTEIYFCSSDLTKAANEILDVLKEDLKAHQGTIEEALYFHFEYECFKHLARVTTGLDSAIVTETEIQGQVKKAYEDTSRIITLPYDIHFLFQKSLRIGKQVRSKLPLIRGVPGLEDAVWNLGRQTFGDRNSVNILMVGASAINHKILTFLKKRQLQNITLCNRSSISPNHLTHSLEWADLHRWSDFDWIIFGTASPDYLVSAKEISLPSTHPKLVIDLCVPRNVDPALGLHPNIFLFNIDQLNQFLDHRKEKLKNLVEKAESLIVESTKRQIERFKVKEIALI